MRGVAPASATEDFKNERRERLGGVMVNTVCPVEARLGQVAGDVAESRFLDAILSSPDVGGIDACGSNRRPQSSRLLALTLNLR